jgi:hypothetical protein
MTCISPHPLRLNATCCGIHGDAHSGRPWDHSKCHPSTRNAYPRSQPSPAARSPPSTAQILPSRATDPSELTVQGQSQRPRLASPDCCTRHSHRIAGISIERASERAICAAEEKGGNCVDMAMLLDAGVVGCAAQLAPTVASSSSSSSSPCVAGMGVRSLPVARGLRIFSSRTRLSSPSASPSCVRSQRRGVLCEAQETVTGGTPMHSAMLSTSCERIPGSAFPRVCTPHAFPMSERDSSGGNPE